MKFKIGDELRRITPEIKADYQVFHLSSCKTFYGIFKFHDKRKENLSLSVEYVDSRFELNYLKMAKKEVTDWIEE